MAEYIDRTQIPYAKISCLDKGSLVTRPMIESMATADVVEREEYDLLKRQLSDSWDRIDELDKLNGHMREQVDKAIEEINNMTYIGFCAEALGNKVLVFKDDVLEILKRNIGE